MKASGGRSRVDITPGTRPAPSASSRPNFRTCSGREPRRSTRISISARSTSRRLDKDLIEVSVKYRKETGEAVNSGLAACSRPLATPSIEECAACARWEHTEDTWINDFKLTYEDVSLARRRRGIRFDATGRSRLQDAAPARHILRIGGGPNFQDKGQKGWARPERLHLHRLRRPHDQGRRQGQVGRRSTRCQHNQSNAGLLLQHSTMPGPAASTTTSRTGCSSAFDPAGRRRPAVKSDNFQFGALHPGRLGRHRPADAQPRHPLGL